MSTKQVGTGGRIFATHEGGRGHNPRKSSCFDPSPVPSHKGGVFFSGNLTRGNAQNPNRTLRSLPGCKFRYRARASRGKYSR